MSEKGATSFAGRCCCRTGATEEGGEGAAAAILELSKSSSKRSDRGLLLPRWSHAGALPGKGAAAAAGLFPKEGRQLLVHAGVSKGSSRRKEQGSAGEIGVELEVRMIDENDILLVSDTEPEFNRHQAGYVNTGGMQQMTSLPGND